MYIKTILKRRIYINEPAGGEGKLKINYQILFYQTCSKKA